MQFYTHNLCVCVCAETGLMVFIVSLVVGLILLLVLVIGSLMYCLRKRRPAKRYRAKFLLLISVLNHYCMYSKPNRAKHVYLLSHLSFNLTIVSL